MVPDGVVCRDDGLHVVETARLRVVSARLSDLRRAIDVIGEPDVQRWMGWRNSDLWDERRRLAVTIPRRPGRVLPVTADQFFFAGLDRRTEEFLVGLWLDRLPGGHAYEPTPYNVGGVTRADARGRGYATETLRAVARAAHQHFGLARLLAACETTNERSRRWLSASGFRQTAGPPTHRLPNGRVMPATWFTHEDADARLACPHLRPNRLARLLERVRGR